MLSRGLSIAATLLLTGLAAAAAEPSSPPPHVQFGIQTGQQNVTWADILSTWKEAEALGFDSAWVWDHLDTSRH
jgi:Spy/CpxP family protein refolding chaperone